MCSTPWRVSRRPITAGRMPWRIAKGDDPVADDHRDHRVAAAAAPMHGLHRVEDVRHLEARRWRCWQLVREHVQQHLGVRAGVQMAPVLAHQQLGKLGGVGEVAVVPEADAVRRVDVERLGLGGTRTAGRRIAHVADTDVALQPQHVALLEDVAHQAVALADEQPPVLGHDAGGVLAAMLQHRQRIVDGLVDGFVPDDSDDSAHDLSVSPRGRDAQLAFAVVSIPVPRGSMSFSRSPASSANSRSPSARRSPQGISRDCCHQGSAFMPMY
jgi:hypothetical protein